MIPGSIRHFFEGTNPWNRKSFWLFPLLASKVGAGGGALLFKSRRFTGAILGSITGLVVGFALTMGYHEARKTTTIPKDPPLRPVAEKASPPVAQGPRTADGQVARPLTPPPRDDGEFHYPSPS